jgi:flagellar hook-associated protein 1 FlgK
MSKIINIDANEVVYGTLPTGEPDKRLSITISGKAIVDHFFKSDLKLTQRDETENINEVDIDELYEISWADGNELTVRGGELKGLLDVRDGNEGDTGPNGLEAPLYKGIPFYMKKMNEFVRTFAMAFNEGYIDRDEDGTIGAGEDGIGHADSFDTAGNTGTRFFTFMDEDGNEVDTTTFLDGAVTTAQIVARYDDLTAANFSLSEELKNDYTMLATGDTSGEIGNTVNLNELLKLRHDVDMFAEGGAEDFMKALVATLGIDSQQAGRYYDNQHAITFHINNRRQSESGVSIDEEMSNLVKFQHAYNASAKMIQTMSELFDTLINRLY